LADKEQAEQALLAQVQGLTQATEHLQSQLNAESQARAEAQHQRDAQAQVFEAAEQKYKLEHKEVLKKLQESLKESNARSVEDRVDSGNEILQKFGSVTSAVIFTGDVIRPSKTEDIQQEPNIKWLSSVFSGPIDHAINGSPERKQIELRINVGELQASKRIYEAMGKKFSEQDWPFLYHSILNAQADLILHDCMDVSKGDLVVGFELSPCIKNWLSRTNVNFIDIRVSPYRYLDDYLLCFSSSNKQISGRLEKYRIKESFLREAAKIQKTRRRSKTKNINPNALVFFDQIPTDASLVEKNGYDTFRNYREEIVNCASRYSAHYYKPHPYYKDESAIEFFSELGFEYVEDNAYDLMSINEVSGVLALNSSVLYEAPFFDKKVERLRQVDLYSGSIAIGKECLGSAFWGDILGLESSSPNVVYSTGSGGFKDVIQAYWSA
jgi:hypothetical protein